MRFSNASLFTAEPRAIYGAIITTDRLLYHPANILGRNPIAAQPLHTSSGPGNGQVKRSACRKHFCQTLLGPGTPARPLFMAREEAVSSCPPSRARAVGAGDNSVGCSAQRCQRGFPQESAPVGAGWMGFTRNTNSSQSSELSVAQGSSGGRGMVGK